MRILNQTFFALVASFLLVVTAPNASAEPATAASAQDHNGAHEGAATTEEQHAAGDEHANGQGGTNEHGDAGHGDAHHADTKGYGGDGHGEGHHDDHHDAGIDWLGLAQHLFNLTVLLGVLFFFGRKAIGDALRQRGLGIRNNLTEAARERDEAKQRHADIEARLTRFETELADMRDEAEQSAKDEELKLIQRAEEASARIAETAERNIRDEVVRAQVALRKEAVELAVKLAEDTLKGSIQADDHRRLARQFLESLDD